MRSRSALAAQVTAAGEPDSDTAEELSSSGGTTNVAAYDDYLRGRALYDLSSDEAAERAALARFDAAIATDPDYAAAHAARSRSLTAIANQYGEVGQLDELYAAAIVSARRAIELAPKFADAYSTLGFVLFQGRLDARAAREPFENSRRLGPGEANVLARYSLYSARIGRNDEAAEAMRRALVLDPLNPLIHRAAGAIQYAARNYADSIPPAEQALSMNPKMSRAHAAIGDALLMLGRPSEARAAYALEPAQDVSLTGLAIVEWKLGNAPAARAAMTKLVADLGERGPLPAGPGARAMGRDGCRARETRAGAPDGRFRSNLCAQRSIARRPAHRTEIHPVACEHRIRPGHIEGEISMKTITTSVAVLLASMFMAACGNKESAAPAEVAPATTPPPAETAPADDIRGPGEHRGRTGDEWRQSRAEGLIVSG